MSLKECLQLDNNNRIKISFFYPCDSHIMSTKKKKKFLLHVNQLHALANAKYLIGK